MNTGANSFEERRAQREVLRQLYPDYDARRHDVYVIRYNKEQDAKALCTFMERRGIKPLDEGGNT